MNEAIFKGLQKIVSERLNEISENSKQFVEEEVDFEPRPSRNTSKEWDSHKDILNDKIEVILHFSDTNLERVWKRTSEPLTPPLSLEMNRHILIQKLVTLAQEVMPDEEYKSN